MGDGSSDRTEGSEVLERDAPGADAPPPALPALPEPAEPEPTREAAPAARGGGWVEAVSAAPGTADPLAPLRRPRDARPSAELGHVPFLVWLADALRPRATVLLGLGRGVACHALCEAGGRLGLDPGVVAYAAPGEAAALGPGYAAAAEAADALHRVRTASAAQALEMHRGPVDLLLVLGPTPPQALEGWRDRVAPGGAVLRFGGAGGRLRFGHCGGLAVDFGACPPLAALTETPQAAERAAALFARLGEPPEAAPPDDAAAWRMDEALAALGAALRERGALAERLRAEARDLRLAEQRRDALWARTRELRLALEGAEAALEERARALADAERRLSEAEGAAETQRAARLRAEEELEGERAAREAAEALPRADPWVEARSAILAAEVSARRAQRPWRPDARRIMGQPSTRRQIETIRGSALFDPAWYRARNPDLGAIDPARHYLSHGAAEGRDPGPDFDGRRYYLANPDVAGAGWNALVHYELFGRAEGRLVAPAGGGGMGDAALLEGSELFDAGWYAERHPDLPHGMTPAEHYLTFGAEAGDDPGPRFSTREYLEANPDVEGASLNPLVHYLRHGRSEGRRARPGGTELRRVGTMRTQLLSLGFTDGPLRGLEAAATGSPEPEARERAALELGRWHMRRENGPAPGEALRWLDVAVEVGASQDTRERAAVMRVACLDALGRRGEARRFVEEAREAGVGTPGLTLASSVLEEDEAGRLARINDAMRAYDLPDVALRPEGEGATLYDRLRTDGEPRPATGGPLVSIIVAAYGAEATLPLTLKALGEQSWRDHEVIVVDDASKDGTRAVAERFAARDGRVRVLPLERNVGAYAARNRGLSAARGEFVCLQDADDWTHATRIEIQARHLAAHPGLVACTSQQARLRDDLTLAHFSAHGDLIFTSIASLMFRRKPVASRLGGWDEVRFSADHELIRRIHDAFGRPSVENLATGPVTIQRYSDGSAIADQVTGFSGAYSGARLEYFEAQRHHRRRGGSIRYRPGARPFPVPRIMRPEGRRGESRHLDVVLASEFRMMGGSVKSCIEEIRAQRAAGLTTGLVKMYRYDLPQPGRVDMLSIVREEIDGEAVSTLAFGERVTCDLLIVRYPPVLRHAQRYLPRVEPGRIKVVVNQPPMSDYGPGGRRRYEIAAGEARLRDTFGRPGEWHPIGPLVRGALHEHHADELGAIDLRPEDWINVIDLAEWDRGLGGGPRPGRAGPLRIGRHARDNPVKWPATAEAVLEVYPEAPDLEVHVLGGAQAPAALIGRVPANWRVAPFGARSPREFLADIDVFVYFTNPDWVESFGRAIIEAMAAGVPCILPPSYEAVFGDAAAYAEPRAAADAARRLHADPEAYRAQARRAQALVRARFGHDHHVLRLAEAGVRGVGGPAG